MLEVARGYWNTLSEERKLAFRFVHISTDEVYGNLGENQSLFKEDPLYLPSGLDSASKPQVIILCALSYSNILGIIPINNLSFFK